MNWPLLLLLLLFDHVIVSVINVSNRFVDQRSQISCRSTYFIIRLWLMLIAMMWQRLLLLIMIRRMRIIMLTVLTIMRMILMLLHIFELFSGFHHSSGSTMMWLLLYVGCNPSSVLLLLVLLSTCCWLFDHLFVLNTLFGLELLVTSRCRLSSWWTHLFGIRYTSRVSVGSGVGNVGIDHRVVFLLGNNSSLVHAVLVQRQ